MSLTFAQEMTFLPLRSPHEIVNKRSGTRLIKRINAWLTKSWDKTKLGLKAKLDPQKNPYGPNTTWVVEVVPYTSFRTAWCDKDNADYAVFCKGIDYVIAGMRERFKLAPSVVRRKGNVDLHAQSGGGHIHVSADIFCYGETFYRAMERFHRDIAVDYANRPYARWLLAHWIGDGGSRVSIDRARLEQRTLNGAKPPSAQDLFSRLISGASAIEPRFMPSQKNSYLTFEFRIVGMVENARQLCAAVRLLKAWMAYRRDHVRCNLKPLRFTLTTEKWDSYTKEDTARAACKGWVESLGLDWTDYEEDFFGRNYLMRINHGAFV